MKNVTSEVAYIYIRDKILKGLYQPGATLTTSALSEEIGISRTPVRDALRKLEADGLVIIQTHLGASVRSMNSQEFRELCVFRLALEGFVAGLAAQNRTADDLREIRHALESMREFTNKITSSKDFDEESFKELVRYDVQFHLAIIAAAKNEPMKREILRLHLINRIVATPLGSGESSDGIRMKEERDTERTASLQSHEEIFQAIERQDVAGAKAAMEKHIQHVIDVALQLVEQRSEERPAKKSHEVAESFYAN